MEMASHLISTGEIDSSRFLHCWKLSYGRSLDLLEMVKEARSPRYQAFLKVQRVLDHLATLDRIRADIGEGGIHDVLAGGTGTATEFEAAYAKNDEARQNVLATLTDDDCRLAQEYEDYGFE